MEQANVRRLFWGILLPAIALFRGGIVFGRDAPVSTPQTRANAIRDVLDTVETIPKEPPRTFRTDDQYVRFMMVPPSTHFAVDQANRATPQAAAGWFLNRWRNLFVNESPAVEFDVIRINTIASRSYVRYRQTFAGMPAVLA